MAAGGVRLRKLNIRWNMEKMDAVAALAALAQDNRLEVLRLLVQAGSDGMTIKRSLSDTVAGIAPSGVVPFIAAQLVGAVLAVLWRTGYGASLSYR